MKYFYPLLAITCMLAFYSCMKVSGVKSFESPRGLYVNTSLMDSCKSGKLLSMPFLFLDLNFKDSTAVVVNLGDEKFSLPIKLSAKENHFSISRPSSFGEVSFEIISGTTILLHEMDKAQQISDVKFEKYKGSDDAELNFEYMINECLLEGEYILFKNGVKQPGIVSILANGQLNGLKPFLGYSLCLGSSCRDKYDFNVIHLIDQSGNKSSFELKAEGKNRLQFFAISSEDGNNTSDVHYELQAH